MLYKTIEDEMRSLARRVKQTINAAYLCGMGDEGDTVTESQKLHLQLQERKLRRHIRKLLKWKWNKL